MINVFLIPILNLHSMFYPINTSVDAIRNLSKVRKEKRVAKRQAKELRAWLAKPYMFSAYR